MRLEILAALAAPLGLAACVHQPITTASADMAWTVDRAQASEAALQFGAPDSDRVLLTLACEPHSGDVDITVGAPARRMTLVSLASEKQASHYIMEPGLSADDEPVLSGATKAADPVLGRFAQTGELALNVAGRWHVLPVNQAQASWFVAACRR